MSKHEVLELVSTGEIDPSEALGKLYPPPAKFKNKARFIKLNIHTDDPTANKILGIIFAIPFPMIFIRMATKVGTFIAKRASKHMNFDFYDGDAKEIIDELSKMTNYMVKYAKGTKVQVDTSDAKIDIEIV